MNLKRILKFLTPVKAGDKEVSMADPITQGSPPAGNGGLSEEAIARIVQGAVTAAIGPAVAAAVKPLNERIETLSQGQQALSESVKKAATAETVTKAVNDQLAAQQATAAQGRARDVFVAEQLKNVPAAYVASLGNDPAKWADEAKGIRETFTADLAKLGVKPAAVTTAAAGGGVNADAVVDMSKLSGAQLIQLAAKQSANAPVNVGPALGSKGAEQSTPTLATPAAK